MRILFVHNLCGRFGGAEQVVSDLAHGLSERGHICDLAYGIAGRNAEEFGSLFSSASCCRDADGEAAAVAGEPFRAIVDRIQPDTIFFHNMRRLPNFELHANGARTVRMVHDVSLVCPTGLGYFRHGKRACHHPVSWRCWADLGFCAKTGPGILSIRYNSIGACINEIRRNQRLDRIVTVSRYMKQRLVANGFEADRITVAAPALHAEAIQVTPVPETPEILFVGSLLRGKGVDLLFRALHRLRVPFHLSIVGAGKSRLKLEQMCARLGLQDKTTFCGWVPPSDLASFYARARLVVVPTRAPESFCLIGPEAMRHGRPVVAFDVGGIADWLEHEQTGLLVPEQDVDKFAQAIERMLIDTAFARQLGTQAEVRVVERFSPIAFLNRIEAILG